MSIDAIPRDALEQIRLYVEDRVPPGSFLYAVLANDLYRAASHADERNRAALADIAQYVDFNVPMPCRGSPWKVERWLKWQEVRCDECDAVFGTCSCVDSEPAIRS